MSRFIELALLDITATVENPATLLAVSMFHFGIIRIGERKHYLRERGVHLLP